MRSRLRPAVILGVLMTALAAFAFTSSHASHKVGQKTAPTPTPPQYQPPTITLDSDAQVVTLCPAAESLSNPRLHLKATAVSPEGKPLRYKWTAPGGRL